MTTDPLDDITITYDESALRDLIKKQLDELGYCVKKINFKVSKTFVGIGQDEHEVHTFDGAEVDIKKKE